MSYGPIFCPECGTWMTQVITPQTVYWICPFCNEKVPSFELTTSNTTSGMESKLPKVTSNTNTGEINRRRK